MHAQTAILKRRVIVGSYDVQKSGLFYTIMEMFSRLKE